MADVLVAQFDVYPNPDPEFSDQYPWLVDVQHRVADHLQSRLVVPLAKVNEYGSKVMKGLTPLVRVKDSDYYFLVPLMSAISVFGLNEAVANLESQRSTLVSALDLVFTGA